MVRTCVAVTGSRWGEGALAPDSRWWGSSGIRSGTGPGECRPIRRAAPPPRSAVPAAACSRDLRARPPRPLPRAGRANAGAADAALTTYPSPTTGLSPPRFEDQEGRPALKILICGSVRPVNALPVLSVLVAGKASAGVRDAPVRRARSSDHAPALGLGPYRRLALIPLLPALPPAGVALVLGRIQPTADTSAGVTQVMRHG